jgi:hypothetical protein
MTTLHVRDFSCIESATVGLARLTVLIGPQASGKSVLSKLIYFFQEAVEAQFSGADIEQDFNVYADRVTADFKRWFPPSAWGPKKFQIRFEAGDITITIDRKKSYKKPSEQIHIVFSEQFHSIFQSASTSYADALKKASSQGNPRTYMRWEIAWQVRTEMRKLLSDAMGDAYSESQMFIPAGRAFFTSVGRAMAAFEKSGFLDPATLAFGRFWAAMRDRDELGFVDHGFPRANAKLMSEIFGGELRVDRDLEYVLSPDGRKVPLSALSSGQQELLPLWLALEQYFNDDLRDQSYTSMMYIEEPEAHLFPHAQSALIDFLTAKLYVPSRNRRRMLITTHSPYVLAKINNLTKASIVAKKASKEQVAQISAMLPRQSWLRLGDISAYAIIDRKIVSIINREGLIDAAYLDSVSDHIMNQFSSLLEIEYGE